MLSGAAAQAAPINLLTNGGNDMALVGGEIVGWSETVGTNWTQRSSNPVAQAGSAYFFAGVGAGAELTQVVNVTSFATEITAGTQAFAFDGYVRSFNQVPIDSSHIRVSYLDSAMSTPPSSR